MRHPFSGSPRSWSQPTQRTRAAEPDACNRPGLRSLGAWRGLGLTGSARRGDHARFAVDGSGPTEGVVYFANGHTMGIRTQDALYRFLRGFGKPVIAAHHLFAPDADPGQAQQAWESWLASTLT